ncbi:hypothetical protein Phi17218_152 [Cellulophaga phage phi17:2_18]|uniref:Uncharacterized protein n=2 Tax=Lightbulbvirus Cba172 TaxID=1918525 RepID=R9ZYT7_9CAUD|nr:hypothetical protein Phi17:2_gp152 [Cellulophaga phage phi17:2]AGO47685.1 hypothetical protein Phi17:2_gp152 [Cellulophaga phage phi17:2]ALO80555.1 hypothetical protein Phi17218_152 [Cellulophaga phage phi17:2_18]
MSESLELYAKDDKGVLREVTLFAVLSAEFERAGFKMDSGAWKDEDHNWLGIVQENSKSEQIVTNITFKNNMNTITGLDIYVTPIKRVVDEDESVNITG